MSDHTDGGAMPPALKLPPARKRVRQVPQIPADDDQLAPSERAEYEVGYGKPPKHTQFKPGQSGNPKGRPKGAKGLTTIAREVLTRKVHVRTAEGVKTMSHMEALVFKQTELAMKGNPRALIELMKLYEKAVCEPVQSVESAPVLNDEDLTAADRKILAALVSLAEPSAGGEL